MLRFKPFLPCFFEDDEERLALSKAVFGSMG
jgi:hypothetical protein